MRWTPTESKIERLLIDTSTQRDNLSVVLRNQKVSIRRPAKPNQRYPFKNVNRNVHFVYFDSDTQMWTGQIHRNQTEWQYVEFDPKHKNWKELTP